MFKAIKINFFLSKFLITQHINFGYIKINEEKAAQCIAHILTVPKYSIKHFFI